MRGCSAGAPAVVAVILVTIAAVPATASQDSPPTVRLLDVPFLSQPERLCGGAAAAMVLRYWGARGVQPEDFLPLVEETAGGIRTSALRRALIDRGWRVLALDGTAPAVRTHLDAGRPVLALIEDRPGRYHYIVIVGWTGDRVVFHDPARTPFRVAGAAAFDVGWRAAERWAIVVLPPRGAGLLGGADPSRPPDGPRGAGLSGLPSDPCTGLVAEGVRLAQDGDRARAESALEAAVDLCPSAAPAHVELGGLRFLQQRWRDAARLAARAAALDPRDEQAWRLLATSRFLDGHEEGALDAWNRIGEPRVDLVRIDGLLRTTHRTAERLIDVRPGALLTADLLRRARRRLATMPALGASRVSYRPAEDGIAVVEAAVVERPAVPSLVTLAVRGARALVEREAVADAASLAHGGERVVLRWRFWESRPAISATALAPSLFGVTGLWTIEGAWERQPFALGGSMLPDEAEASYHVEDRRRAAVTFSDWPTARLRVDAGAGVDRWRGRGARAWLGGGAEGRWLGDAIATRLEAAAWPYARGDRFTSGAMRMAWRAAPSAAVSARAGLEAASARAPRDLWPGAGTGQARAALLRAHPLLDDGVVAGAAFGRTLAHATVEAERGVATRGLVRTGLVIFADAARAWHSPAGTARAHVDLGAGIRLRLPGDAGAIAIDIARGLRDGKTALSARWAPPWPGW